MTAYLRPKFHIETSLSSAEVIKRIKLAVHESQPVKLNGQFRGEHAVISIVETERHFWSPWMHLEICDDEPQLKIRGNFSPHPSIWTGFAFGYLACSVLAFFSVIFGFSQQIAGERPYGYFGIPICVALASLLWLAAQTGQRLARDEMESMRRMLEETLEHPQKNHIV